MFSPQSAADWLSERLGRPVSRQSVQSYIQSGNLAAVNLRPDGERARWIVEAAALEQLRQQLADYMAAHNGELLPPTGGWPQRPGVQRGVGRGRRGPVLDTES